MQDVTAPVEARAGPALYCRPVFFGDPPMGAQWKAKPRAEAAAARGKLFTKLAKEIIVAAKVSADPESNPRLRKAIEQARRASMPKDTLERAIKKGAGLLDGEVHYETVTYEGFAPHRLIVCLPR